MTLPSDSSKPDSANASRVGAGQSDTLNGDLADRSDYQSEQSPNGSNQPPPTAIEEPPSFADKQSHARGTFSSLSENVSAQRLNARRLLATAEPKQPPLAFIIFLAIAIMVAGLALQNPWIGIAGASVALLVSLRVLWIGIRAIVIELLSEEQRALTVSTVGIAAAAWGMLQITGYNQRLINWFSQLDWEAIGASGEVFGAVGQILIAVITVYIAWRQYVISKDLTIQQNVITQQQTIDSYFQGISDLVLDAEGLLEDWPQERAIAEGRTAAILSSVDAGGKAKVLRFLSRSRLLTPLKRDSLLGRAILDGSGGYQEDRDYGVRVIDLGVMLAASELEGTDLRWTDLSEANLIRANLAKCDLVKANLARTILCDAELSGSDMMGTRLFYGSAKTASPRSRTIVPNYKTGAYTGAVIENADFSGVKRLSEEQRYYCCAWGGSNTRATIPGGCEGIPNQLGR